MGKNEKVVENKDTIKEEKKTKKSKKKIFIIIGAFILLVAIILSILFICTRSKDKEKQTVAVYVDSDKQLKYITSNNYTPVTVDSSYKDDVVAAIFNDNNTRFLYTNNNDLYVYDINASSETMKVCDNVLDYGFLDTEFYYITGDNALYLNVNNKDRIKVDIDVDNVLIASNNIIIYNKTNDLYFYNFDNDEKTSISNNYDEGSTQITYNLEIGKVLFKNDDNKLYVYDIESKKAELIDEDVKTINGYSDDFGKIIYAKFVDSKTYFDAFIIDDVDETSYKNQYICTVYSDGLGRGISWSYPSSNQYVLYYDLSDGLYYYYVETFEGWNKVRATDELYNACTDNGAAKEFRDTIRQDESELEFYDVYYYDGTEKKVIVSGVNDLGDVDIDTKNVVYRKYILSEENKKKLSSLPLDYDINDIIYEMEYTVYYGNEDTTDNIIYKGNDRTSFAFIGDSIYYYAIKGKDYELDNSRSLYKFDIKTNSKEQISNNAVGYNMESDYFEFLYLDNFDYEKASGNLFILKDNKKVLIDNDVFYSNIYTKDDTIVYYKNYNHDNNANTLMLYNLETKKKEEINDVYSFVPISFDKLFIMKDYSSSSDTTSFYVYDNKELKKVEYNVKDYSISY